MKKLHRYMVSELIPGTRNIRRAGTVMERRFAFLGPDWFSLDWPSPLVGDTQHLSDQSDVCDSKLLSTTMNQ